MLSRGHKSERAWSAVPRLRAIGRRASRLCAAFAIALTAGACISSVSRAPYDESEHAAAQVSGFGDVRFFADGNGSAIARRLSERVRDEARAGGARGSINWLMLSGGGEDGAYGAGVLVGLTKAGRRPEFELVSGVSTGALIAPFAFLGSDYDESLRTVYTGLGKDDVIRFTSIINIIGGASVFDTAPLRAVIEQQVDEVLLDRVAAAHRRGRRLFVVTTHLDAQRPMIWDMGAIAATPSPRRSELFRDVLLASASIPGVFPPVFIDAEANGRALKEMHVDGGTTMQVLTLPAALNPRMISGASDGRRRNLYMLMNNKLSPSFDTIEDRTFKIAGRSLSTIIKYHGIQSIDIMYTLAQRFRASFNLTYIEPDFREKLPGPFDKKYMNALFDYGFQRAIAGRVWREAPPGVGRP